MNIVRPVVVRRPRIALVSTGDELVSPGPELEPGQVRDGNGPALTAATRAAGAEIATSVRVGDDRAATVETLGGALEGADIVVTVGGVSVGPHDHVRPALEELGAEQVFCRVSLKPGGQVCFTSMLGLAVIALVPEDCEVLRAGEPVDIEFVG